MGFSYLLSYISDGGIFARDRYMIHITSFEGSIYLSLLKSAQSNSITSHNTPIWYNFIVFVTTHENTQFVTCSFSVMQEQIFDCIQNNNQLFVKIWDRHLTFENNNNIRFYEQNR